MWVVNSEMLISTSCSDIKNGKLGLSVVILFNEICDQLAHFRQVGIYEADRKGRQTILDLLYHSHVESHLLIADCVLWNLKRNVETI